MRKQKKQRQARSKEEPDNRNRRVSRFGRVPCTLLSGFQRVLAGCIALAGTLALWRLRTVNAVCSAYSACVLTVTVSDKRTERKV